MVIAMTNHTRPMEHAKAAHATITTIQSWPRRGCVFQMVPMDAQRTRREDVAVM
jgi:hypothetical protein